MLCQNRWFSFIHSIHLTVYNKFLVYFSCLHVPFAELGRRMVLGWIEHDYFKAHISRQETKRRVGCPKWPCGIKVCVCKYRCTYKSKCGWVCIVKYILNYLDLCLIYASPNTFWDVLLLSSRSKCACLQLTARCCSKTSLSPSSKTSHGYSYKRLEGPVPSG